VFRSIYTCRNAELQSRAMAIGSISTLSPGEAEMCGAHSLTPRTLSRVWEYWTYRLAKVEAATAPPGSKPPAVKAPVKSAARRRKASAASTKRAAARPAGAARKAKRAKRR
jgi:HCOMODA/2-hydroxy-3-carboxy-muconic semialdehyde decarboxylase